MSEPERVLLRAATERIQPFVNHLRTDGWAVEVVAHIDPLALNIRIDLSGLKRPTEAK